MSFSFDLSDENFEVDYSESACEAEQEAAIHLAPSLASHDVASIHALSDIDDQSSLAMQELRLAAGHRVMHTLEARLGSKANPLGASSALLQILAAKAGKENATVVMADLERLVVQPLQALNISRASTSCHSSDIGFIASVAVGLATSRWLQAPIFATAPAEVALHTSAPDRRRRGSARRRKAAVTPSVVDDASQAAAVSRANAYRANATDVENDDSGSGWAPTHAGGAQQWSAKKAVSRLDTVWPKTADVEDDGSGAGWTSSHAGGAQWWSAKKALSRIDTVWPKTAKVENDGSGAGWASTHAGGAQQWSAEKAESSIDTVWPKTADVEDDGIGAGWASTHAGGAQQWSAEKAPSQNDEDDGSVAGKWARRRAKRAAAKQPVSGGANQQVCLEKSSAAQVSGGANQQVCLKKSSAAQVSGGADQQVCCQKSSAAQVSSGSTKKVCLKRASAAQVSDRQTEWRQVKSRSDDSHYYWLAGTSVCVTRRRT
eukprot:CAMPEP_0204126134 /NCGR_PEP_ID=MMETSP0361-20130328/10825_1 /ASSEMBLY_ACC=CAM_ASM_000343 /TAXON_ID=268821 /ORGANISM="Scrippsiella Hangoei, Strain SHTV-5" /LENGTH=488 /DNA_ID=CAMNT_0051077953 /DNA_START=47 /DNA_END=1513 /DNA_ORIENTATION=+